MKNIFFLATVLSLTLSSCLPAILQNPTATPLPTQNLAATAAVFAQQTLQALPSLTVEPSITPVIMLPSPTETPAPLETPTETQNPILLTLTATLGTGTPTALSGPQGTPTTSIIDTLPLTTSPSATPNPAFSATPTGTPHRLYSGTMPPNLPFGEITLINKSKAEAYISLRCVTRDNFVTIIEYPVNKFVTAKAPAGQYTYVLWVGGNKLVGSFSLGKSEELTINIFKDRVGIR